MSSQIQEVPADCQIVSTRVVKAPVDIVFRAWSDPVHLQNWWGPAGFTNTFKEFEFRPGGKWSFIMHGPDKGNYANECVFIKIVRPELIAWYRLSQPVFKVVVSFEHITTKQTQVVFKMLFETAAECNKIRPLAAEKNEENFDRLEEELRKMLHAKQEPFSR